MNWLFWKDYRENRLVVFTALFLLLTPHLFALYAGCEVSVRGARTYAACGSRSSVRRACSVLSYRNWRSL